LELIALIFFIAGLIKYFSSDTTEADNKSTFAIGFIGLLFSMAGCCIAIKTDDFVPGSRYLTSKETNQVQTALEQTELTEFKVNTRSTGRTLRIAANRLSKRNDLISLLNEYNSHSRTNLFSSSNLDSNILNLICDYAVVDLQDREFVKSIRS
jgi:hypothetical protein